MKPSQSYLFATVAAGLLILSSACLRPATSDNAADSDSITENVICDLTESASCKADSLLAHMSDDKRYAQLIMPAVYAASDPYTLSKLKEYSQMGVGGVILLKGDIRSAAVIADSLARWAEIPMFVAIDAEWGLAMRLKDAPLFPENSKISEQTSENILYDYGREVARECRRIGINMVLGPVVDIAAKDSYIGRRSFGMNPERVGALAVAYAHGLESGNVMSVAKHFPGHGAAEGNSHRGKLTIGRSLHSLDSLDLSPFREYIANGLSAIMVGHLAFPAIDPQMLPAAVSPVVIGDLLRRDMGFDGLVLTDAMNMLGAEGYGADTAISAGADMILAPADTYQAVESIKKAADDGRITDSRLNDALRRILLKKFLLQGDNPSQLLHSDSISASALRSEETGEVYRRLLSR